MIRLRKIFKIFKRMLKSSVLPTKRTFRISLFSSLSIYKIKKSFSRIRKKTQINMGK